MPNFDFEFVSKTNASDSNVRSALIQNNGYGLEYFYFILKNRIDIKHKYSPYKIKLLDNI